MERMAGEGAVQGLGLAQGPRRRRCGPRGLGADPDPECWVIWGDDPRSRYMLLAPTAERARPGQRPCRGPGRGPACRWQGRALAARPARRARGRDPGRPSPGDVPGRDPGAQRRRRRGRCRSRSSRRPCSPRSMADLPRRPSRSRRAGPRKPGRRPGPGRPGPATGDATRPRRRRPHADSPPRRDRPPDRSRDLRPGRRDRRLGDLVGRDPSGVRGGTWAGMDRRGPGRGDGREFRRLGADHARAPRPRRA